jgi:hypothetical protein
MGSNVGIISLPFHATKKHIFHFLGADLFYEIAIRNAI